MAENDRPVAEFPSSSEESTTHEAVNASVAVVTKDFGFLPIPRRLRREDTSKPIGFGLILNVGFGIASTFSEWKSLYNVVSTDG